MLDMLSPSWFSRSFKKAYEYTSKNTSYVTLFTNNICFTYYIGNRRRHGGVKIIFEVQMNTKWMSQVSIGLEDGQKRLKLWDYREYSQHYNVRLKERHFTHLRLRYVYV